MTQWKPLLQIVHISDLHFCDNYDDKQKLIREQRFWRLKARRWFEERNVGGWHEGSLGHDSVGLEYFEQFLQDYAANEREWFAAENAEFTPQTWLVDTGDATTFGDEQSIEMAIKRIDGWRRLLHDCPARLLYGNHDAWPGGQPVINMGIYDRAAVRQKALVGSIAAWRDEEWLKPLVVQAPGGPRVECYGLDTVSFRFVPNTLALGETSKPALERLCAAIDSQPVPRAYRILATHHPVVYPYEPDDIRDRGIPKMQLRKAQRVLDHLGAAPASSAATRQPYVHLFLSGHTHASYPAAALPDNVSAIHSPGLGPEQLQLVGGSLMQIRDRTRTREDSENPSGLDANFHYKQVAGFSLRRICTANQQFQILRFYYRDNDRTALQLERLMFVRLPNALRYQLVESTISRTRLSC